MLKRLKIWQKFTLIAVAFSLPIVVLSYFLVVETSKNIAYTEAEQDGALYLRPVHSLVHNLSVHRDLVAAGTNDALAAKEKDIDADLAALDAVDRRLGVELGLGDTVKQVRQQWQTLRATLAAGKLDQSFEAHKILIRGIQRLTVLVGNASNLILDPEVDSYYVADALIFKIPRLTEEIAQARAAGMGLYGGAASEDSRARRLQTLAPLVVLIDDALDQELELIKFAFKANRATDQSLSGPVGENAVATRAFLTDLTEKMIAPATPMSAEEFFHAAQKPLQVLDTAWELHMQELDRLLAARQSVMTRSRLTELAAVVVALTLTLLLLTVVVRAITRPIAHLTEIADRISLGDMDANIEIDSLDEIGELGERFRRMQVSLKAAMEALDKQQDDDL